MIHLIINADDLGKDHATNLAIEDALKEGYITSSTIMANSSTWEDVHRIVELYPNASFGVHLNLTEGKALTNSNILRECGVVDENNYFTKKSRFISYANKALEDAVFYEWDAQVNKIINIENINVTHFDGHHHIHMNTAYTKALKRLIEKYHVQWVRRKHNTWCPDVFSGKIKNIISDFLFAFPVIRRASIELSPGLRGRYLKEEWSKEISSVTGMTDYFNGYEQALSFIKKGFTPKDNVVIELMCHPGHPSFEEEFNEIKKHTIEILLPNTKLCSYKDL